MRTAQLLLFCLLVWCQTAECLTDKQVNLGENVTLDCLIDMKEIYWVFQKLTDSPVVILRTFSSDSTTSLINDQRLKEKYSSLILSRLFISNITINELGIYYCAKTGPFLQLSNGTRLYIVEAVQNQTEPNCQSQHQTTQQALIVLYVILNIVMFSAVIGLFQIKLQVCKKRHQQCQNEEMKQLYSTNDEEFSEVEFRLYHLINNAFLFTFQKPKTNPRQT